MANFIKITDAIKTVGLCSTFLGGIMSTAYGATVYLEPYCQGGSVCASVHSGGYYYKCTNTFTTTRCLASVVIVSYTSMDSSHTGSAIDPMILSGCQKVACACGNNSYWSGTECKLCSRGPSGVQLMGAPSTTQYHTNTSCKYCPLNSYMGQYSPAPGVVIDNCVNCPGGGKSDGTGGITSCCIPVDGSGSDNTGSFKIVNQQCCYSA